MSYFKIVVITLQKQKKECSNKAISRTLPAITGILVRKNSRINTLTLKFSLLLNEYCAKNIGDNPQDLRFNSYWQ